MSKSQTIFRVASRHKPYSQLGNAMLRDQRLSLEARGALGFILSHPADWRFSLEWLARETNTGRDKVQRLVRELVDAGYCVRHQHRNERGRLSYVEYAFSDEPGESSPQPEKPVAVAQHLVSPQPEKPRTVKPRTVNPLPTKKVSPKKVSDKIERGPSQNLASPLTDEERLPFSKAVIDELTALSVDVEDLISRYHDLTAGKFIRNPNGYLLRMGLDEAAKRNGVTVEQMRASNSKNRNDRVDAARSVAGACAKPNPVLDDLLRTANARLRQRHGLQ